MFEEYETTKYSRASGTSKHLQDREENPNIVESRSLKEKIYSMPTTKAEHQSSNAEIAGGYKRNSNKKAFKENWTEEEVLAPSIRFNSDFLCL